MLDNDKMHNFVTECREKYPEIKIYPLLLSSSERLHSTLIEEGATRCLQLPGTEYQICEEIVYDFYSDDDVQIIPTIAAFVTSKGFSSEYSGFKFLCYSIEMVVDNPSLLQEITKVLYPTIVEKMDISYGQVERSMRILKDAALKDGACGLYYEQKEKLTNKKIIGRLSKEFAESIGFSTKRFDGFVN